mmetsp:Transcript_80498/g.167742  ORF Transcript_80498/g.167742 Transcript_80498/m.167742 type:complete len:133 (-) Transcript_80498:91-489(-)|eukprot:CAMPEP_0206454156 /NCGR_PEP_ID=MMETSP0324_2-20121206/20973_1 /ASSEMBLY_ACC=CAM_ASM_000836 /TAXON_ID=2866 /ORGANISM="Crypthecodinium cohnii, Strain Seligo" /LENGTH=132 /DNA_ID=CAMNT_0053924583 /DNA_START=470 /DNA_END=868 /DNA_ORIENTATION=+
MQSFSNLFSRHSFYIVQAIILVAFVGVTVAALYEMEVDPSSDSLANSTYYKGQECGGGGASARAPAAPPHSSSSSADFPPTTDFVEDGSLDLDADVKEATCKSRPWLILPIAFICGGLVHMDGFKSTVACTL